MRDIVVSKEVQKYAGEYDSAREYLARWAAGVAEEAERQRSKQGEEVGSIWGTTATNRHAGWEEMSELGGFEVLSVFYLFNILADFQITPPVRVERKKPLDERTWKKFFDHTGRLAISTTEVKEFIFHGVQIPLVCVWIDENRVLIRHCVLRYGNSYYDYIHGIPPAMKEKLFDDQKEMNTFV
jgi:hypothetical protein